MNYNYIIKIGFLLITCCNVIYILYAKLLKEISFIISPTQEFIKESKINSTQDYFKFCVPFIKKKSFSTRRDAVLTAIFFKEKNAPLNLFSIRQSGCEASIIILSNDKMIFSRQTIQMINALGATVAYSPIPEFFKNRKFTHTDRLRDYFAVNFLTKYKSEFDRVFFCDSYDCFFEHDPFEYFTEKKVYLFQEGSTKIADNYYNRRWLLRCYDNAGLEEVGHNLIICSGTVGAGSVDEFIKFYQVMDQENRWDRCKYDQGQVNYLVYSGILDRKKVNYHVFDETGPVQTIALSRKHYDNYFGNPNFTYVKNKLNQIAAVIHQYDRIQELLSGCYSRCNILSFLNLTNANSSHILNSIYGNFIFAKL